MSNERTRRRFVHRFEVEWGDCDPADIVYYPNFYRYFDNASHRMFRQAGFELATVREEHESLGFPLVKAEAEFRSPARVGDRLEIVSEVTAMGRKSITVEHRIRRGDTLLVEGREIRIMGVRTSDGKLTAAVVPAALRTYFGFDAGA